MIRIKNKDFALIDRDQFDRKCLIHIDNEECGTLRYGIKICPRGFSEVNTNDDLYCHFFMDDSTYCNAKFKHSIKSYYKKDRVPKNRIEYFDLTSTLMTISMMDRCRYNDAFGDAIHDLVHIVRDLRTLEEEYKNIQKDISRELNEVFSMIDGLTNEIYEYKINKDKMAIDKSEYYLEKNRLIDQLQLNLSTYQMRIVLLKKVLNISEKLVLITNQKPDLFFDKELERCFEGDFNLLICRITSLVNYCLPKEEKLMNDYPLSFFDDMCHALMRVAKIKDKELKCFNYFNDTSIKLDSNIYSILYVLIENALKYALKNSYIKVETRIKGQKLNQIEFKISNICNPVGYSDTRDLIRRGNSGKNKDEDSTGSGLDIAYNLADQIGAKLRIYCFDNTKMFVAKLVYTFKQD